MRSNFILLDTRYETLYSTVIDQSDERQCAAYFHVVFYKVVYALKSDDKTLECDRFKNEWYFRLMLKGYMYELLIGLNFEALICD